MNAKRKIFVAAGALAALASVTAFSLRGTASEDSETSVPAKPALTVATTTPQSATLTVQLHANGNIAAWQEASIGAEVSGLRLIEVRANVGDVFKSGDTLAVFEDDTVRAELQQMQAKVAEAQAQVADAAANARRARSLVATGALSEQEISALITAEQAAAARLEALRAAHQAQSLRLAKTRVLAPDDGVISARAATVGAVVPAGQELFRMIRQSRLEWHAEVTSTELTRLQAGARATLIEPSGRIVTGTIRMISPIVDDRTRLGLVYVDLPADSGFRAGMFAKGAFDLGASSALTAPQEAVVIRDGFSYVFRVQPDGRVAQVKVRTGRRHAGRIEVLGIEPDTLLVASGAGFLNDGDLVKAAPAPERHAPDALNAAVAAQPSTAALRM